MLMLSMEKAKLRCILHADNTQSAPHCLDNVFKYSCIFIQYWIWKISQGKASIICSPVTRNSNPCVLKWGAKYSVSHNAITSLLLESRPRAPLQLLRNTITQKSPWLVMDHLVVFMFVLYLCSCSDVSQANWICDIGVVFVTVLNDMYYLISPCLVNTCFVYMYRFMFFFLPLPRITIESKLQWTTEAWTQIGDQT